MGIGIVAPAEDACIRNVGWEEVMEPIDIVHSPSLLAVPIKPVNRHNTIINTERLVSIKANATYSRTDSAPSARTLSPKGRVSDFIK